MLFIWPKNSEILVMFFTLFFVLQFPVLFEWLCVVTLHYAESQRGFYAICPWKYLEKRSIRLILAAFPSVAVSWGRPSGGLF